MVIYTSNCMLLYIYIDSLHRRLYYVIIFKIYENKYHRIVECIKYCIVHGDIHPNEFLATNSSNLFKTPITSLRINDIS